LAASAVALVFEHARSANRAFPLCLQQNPGPEGPGFLVLPAFAQIAGAAPPDRRRNDAPFILHQDKSDAKDIARIN
jgi:hypothetical protein